MAKVAVRYDSYYISGKGWHDEKLVMLRNAQGLWKNAEDKSRKTRGLSDIEVSELPDTTAAARESFKTKLEEQRDFYKRMLAEADGTLYKVAENLEHGRIL